MLLVQLIFLTVVTAASNAPKGTIPTGLRFDWFGSICRSSLVSSSYVTSRCKLDRTAEEPDYKSYYECLCHLDGLLVSQLNCMKELTERSGAPQTAIRDSWDGAEYTCHYYGTKYSLSYEDAWAQLEANPVTLTFEEGNATQSAPYEPLWSYLDQELIDSGIEYHAQHYLSELFGQITLWYFYGIIFIQTILHWSQYWFPGFIRVLCNNAVSRQLRRWVVMPATFKRSRAAPVRFLRYILLCYPPRLHVILFLGYFFLDVFFMCFHYHITVSPKFYETKPVFISVYLAWRSGQLGMYKMPLVFLLAGRNNILIWFTGWQMEIFNHWHRWVARLLALDIVIHSLAYSIYFGLFGLSYLNEEYAAETYLQWGAVGTVVLCLLCVNGTKTLRELAYETFLYIHIVLAIFSIVGTYWHVKGFVGFNLIWPAIAFWAFDRLARIVKILWSNPLAKAHVIAHPQGVLEVTVSYSGLWKPRAGTYVFIHFLTGLYAFQSHPFTIVDTGNKGEFKLYCKVLNGATKNLYKKTQMSGGELNCRVLVEGPYGVEFATKMYKEVVLFAGGIGVTAIYSHLKHIASQNVPGQIVHVHWAISNSDPLEWFQKELEYMNSFGNVNIIVHLNVAGTPELSNEAKDKASTSDESVGSVAIQHVDFVPDFDKIIHDHCVNSQGPIVFFVCGPAPMSDAIRSGVTHNLLKTKNYVEYFEESFSM